MIMRPKKKQKAALQELRRKNAARLKKRRLRRARTSLPHKDSSLYDAVYEEGLRWLDGL